jgi:S-methylmethionine-dependent homocysteine/selenocysteine methylase
VWNDENEADHSATKKKPFVVYPNSGEVFNTESRTFGFKI